MKKLLVVAMIGLGLTASGCSVRMADLTVASTKNYNLNSNQFVKGERVTADDSVPVVLFPLGIPNMKTAMGSLPYRQLRNYFAVDLKHVHQFTAI